MSAEAPAEESQKPRARDLGEGIDRTATLGIAAWAGWTASLHLGVLLRLPLWAVVVLACALGGAAGAALVRSGPDDRHPAGRAELLVVLALAVAVSAAQLFISRFDADDVFYLSRASWVGQAASLARPIPTTDGMFSDGAMPYWGLPTLASSFEPAIGLAARLFDVRPGVVAHAAVAPLVAGWAVVMAWRLARTLRREVALSAVIGMVVFLVLDGQRNASLGNTTLFRASQGKMVFLLVVVPWMWLQIARVRERRRLSWALLVGSAAAIGLSPTALLILPLILLGMLIARRAPLRRRIGAIIPAAVYIGAVSLALSFSKEEIAEFGVAPTTSDIVDYAFAGPASIASRLTLLILGLVAIRSAPTRRCAASVLVLVGVIISAQPVLDLLARASHGPVLWRLWWALPAATLIGMGCGAVVHRLPARWRISGVVAIAVAAASAGGLEPVVRSANNVRFGASLTEYPGWWSDSAAAFSAVAPEGTVMGPDWLNFTLAMEELGPIPAWTRDDYVAHAAHVVGESFQYGERQALRSVWTGPERAGDLAAAVESVHIRAVCAPPRRARLFTELGFRAADMIGQAGDRCVVMIHRDAPVDG